MFKKHHLCKPFSSWGPKNVKDLGYCNLCPHNVESTSQPTHTQTHKLKLNTEVHTANH